MKKLLLALFVVAFVPAPLIASDDVMAAGSENLEDFDKSLANMYERNLKKNGTSNRAQVKSGRKSSVGNVIAAEAAKLKDSDKSSRRSFGAKVSDEKRHRGSQNSGGRGADKRGGAGLDEVIDNLPSPSRPKKGNGKERD